MGVLVDEIKKNLIDQPLHILMCSASVLGLASLIQWQSGLKPLTPMLVGVLLTCTWVGLREFFQYPPRETRPWDVWVDATFEVIGIVLGACLHYWVVGPALV
jgi:hypothetical protein